jgi:uncharacterized protein YbaP (TraB family)
MIRSGIACVLGLLFCSAVSAQTDRPTPEVETVVVTGEQPGPRLWKATKDGHTLWIYGTVTPKPRDITWRSKQVAQVLDDTQEVIDQQLQGTTWPANIVVKPDTRNPVKLFSMGRKRQKIREAHPPPPLRSILPPDLYERFARLRNRYAPRNEAIEQLRPSEAASLLYEAAISRAGLTSRAMIHDEVHRLARKRRVEVSEVTLEMRFDADTLEAIQTERSAIPPSAEIECFETTIAQIENELPTITARANAWAIGDVKALQQLPSLRREACDRVRWSTPRWSTLETDLESAWLAQIDASVAENRATLVLLDVAEIFESDGLVAKLIERGYDIEAPDLNRAE